MVKLRSGLSSGLFSVGLYNIG